MSVVPQTRKAVIYPETDGLPMAENTLQVRWIMTIKGNLDVMFRDDPNVFLAADLFWYPIEGDPKTRLAPDVLVAFGRPKGDRRSYRQWEEAGIAPQVVFEIQSPSNRFAELVRKFEFYQRHGVEEYYLFDPDANLLFGWRRQGDFLLEIPEMNQWVSPRLGVRFDMSSEELQLFGPHDKRFLTVVEMAANTDAAERRAGEAEQRAVEAEQKAQRLAARLRELGVDPENGR